MSRKNKNNAQAPVVESTEAQAPVAIEAIAGAQAPVVVPGMGDYSTLVGDLRATVESLATRVKQRRLTFIPANSEKAGSKDCQASLTLALAVIFERIDEHKPAYCYKGEIAGLIGKQTGVFTKHNPDSPLHQGLNKLGGNQFNYSFDKSGERDTWGMTTREDGKPVLCINGRMSENTGEILLNPIVWAQGGYARPSNDEIVTACNHCLRKMKR